MWSPKFSSTLLVYIKKPNDFQRFHFQNGCLVGILDFSVSRLQYGTYCLCICKEACWYFRDVTFSKWPPGDHIGFFGFWTLNFVWLWISSSNFSRKPFVYMERNQVIFSNVTFKMAPCGHMGFFSFPTLTWVWLWTSNPNFTSITSAYG